MRMLLTISRVTLETASEATKEWSEARSTMRSQDTQLLKESLNYLLSEVMSRL